MVDHKTIENVLRRLRNDAGKAGIRKWSRKLVDMSAGVVHTVLGRVHTRLATEAGNEPLLDENNEITALPEGTRYFWQSSVAACVVVEEKPQVRTITYLSSNYRLSFPYFYFVLHFDKTHPASTNAHWYSTCVDVGMRCQPLTALTGVDGEISHVPLPNISATSVCMGARGNQLSGANLPRLVDKIRTSFWLSHFNTDITSNVTACENKSFRDIKKWEALTKEDPLFVLKQKPGHSMPLSAILRLYMAPGRTSTTLADLVNRASNLALKQVSSHDMEAVLAEAIREILTQVMLADEK